MENCRSVCLCLWVLGLGSLPGTTGQTTVDSDLIFTEHPRSTSVLLGDTATLMCRVNTSVQVDEVFWKDAVGNTIDSNGEYKQNFVIKSEIAGQYDLEIIGAAEEDSQSYYCYVENASGQQHLSRVAYLTVKNEVMQNRLSCFVSINQFLTEYDNVVLNCVILTNDTNVFLLWEKDGEVTSLGSTERKNNALTVRKLELELTPDDDNTEYRCVAMIDADTMQDVCVLDPLNVRYAPKVTIIPSTWQYYGYETTYTCQATANPDPNNYAWYISNIRLPMQDLDIYELVSNGRAMTISKTEERDNGQLLRCEVLNDIGIGVGFHLIELYDIMTLIGPIVVGVILFAVLIIVIIFLCWWRSSSRQRASDTSAHHRITTVWSANGSAIQPHKGMDQRHDGSGKIDGKPIYRKGRGSSTASRASTQPDQDELVSPEMLEMTAPASPENNVAYVYDGNLPGSRPETPKLWNIPRESKAEGDDIDSGQASHDNDDSSSENRDDSVTDVGDGTPNPPQPPPQPQNEPDDSITEAEVESIPPPSSPASSNNSPEDDELSLFGTPDGSLSTFQAIEPLPVTDPPHQASSEKDLVYADLTFDPTRPPAPNPPTLEDDKTEYATVDFNRASTVNAPEQEPQQTHTSDMTTEL